MASPNHVFISFSPSDQKFTSVIAGDLQQAGFITQTSRQLENGNHRKRSFEEALKDCAALIAIISPDFLSCKDCQNELTIASEIEFPILSIILRPIQNAALLRTLNRKQCFHFFEWDNETIYSREFDKLLSTVTELVKNGETGHIGYNNTDVPMKRLEGEPPPEESRSNDQSIIEEPDLDILATRRLEVPEGASLNEKFEALNRELARYRQANWWQWDAEKWATYLAHNQSERERRGAEYQERRYERILLEYGKWISASRNVDETDKLRQIQDLTMVYLAFWQFNQEPPPQLHLLK